MCMTLLVASFPTKIYHTRDLLPIIIDSILPARKNKQLVLLKNCLHVYTTAHCSTTPKKHLYSSWSDLLKWSLIHINTRETLDQITLTALNSYGPRWPVISERPLVNLTAFVCPASYYSSPYSDWIGINGTMNLLRLFLFYFCTSFVRFSAKMAREILKYCLSKALFSSFLSVNNISREKVSYL